MRSTKETRSISMSNFNNEPKKQLSIGRLYPAKKTKFKSPDMKGTITIQFEDFQELARYYKKPGDVAVCSIANWFKRDDETNEPYINVTITPPYRPKAKVREPEPENRPAIDQFFKEITKQSDSDEEVDDTEHRA
jgi:hypothetical protein